MQIIKLNVAVYNYERNKEFQKKIKNQSFYFKHGSEKKEKGDSKQLIHNNRQNKMQEYIRVALIETEIRRPLQQAMNEYHIYIIFAHDFAGADDIDD